MLRRRRTVYGKSKRNRWRFCCESLGLKGAEFCRGLTSEEVGLELVRNFEMPCYYVAPIYPHKGFLKTFLFRRVAQG
jgi:hypothetical protein